MNKIQLVASIYRYREDLDEKLRVKQVVSLVFELANLSASGGKVRGLKELREDLDLKFTSPREAWQQLNDIQDKILDLTNHAGRIPMLIRKHADMAGFLSVLRDTSEWEQHGFNIDKEQAEVNKLIQEFLRHEFPNWKSPMFYWTAS